MTNSRPFQEPRARSAYTITFVALAMMLLSPTNSAAQGLPVQNGPMIPVALWWIGSLILGAALAYGILRSRRRTRSEKALTEQGTKELYAEEAREERSKSRSAP